MYILHFLIKMQYLFYCFFQIISMVKGLEMLLGKMEGEFNQAIRRNVYAELQDFVQLSLREPLKKAVKNKKEVLRRWDLFLLLLDFHF